jgi:hypothetical protein
MHLCPPSQLYLAISVIFIILGVIYNVNSSLLVMKVIFAALYTWILCIMCSKKLKELAWAFVLLPFVVIGSAFIYSPLNFKEGIEEEQKKEEVKKEEVKCKFNKETQLKEWCDSPECDPDPLNLPECMNVLFQTGQNNE